MTVRLVRLSLVTGGLMVLLGLGSLMFHSRGARSDRQAPSPSTLASPTTRTASFSYHCSAGKTALELLKLRAVADIRGSSTAPLVVSINGYRADAVRHEYWALLVDGTATDVAIGHYTCQADEELTWKLATY